MMERSRSGRVDADVDVESWGIAKCTVYKAVDDYWTFVWISACLKATSCDVNCGQDAYNDCELGQQVTRIGKNIDIGASLFQIYEYKSDSNNSGSVDSR